MADFKTADICGASPNLNGVLEKMDSLKNSLSSSLTVDPSALASTLSSKVGELSSSLSGMIPELPSAPDVSLQAELTALSNINLSLPSGLLEYRSKLDSITNQFGDSLSTAGVSLDNLVSQVAPSIPSLPGAPSVDLCSVVPNFKLPDGATTAVESAGETLMADAPGVAEKLSEVTANAEVVTVQADLKRVVDAVADGTAYTKATKTVEIKTKDINQESVKVARVKDNLSTTTEVVGGQTITKRERPRTVDKSVAKYFDKPVRKVKVNYVALESLPKGGIFSKNAYRGYGSSFSSLHQRGEDNIKLTELRGRADFRAPKTYPDGTVKDALLVSGFNVVDTFTDTNVQVFMPVEIISVRGIPKNKLDKTGWVQNTKPSVKAAAVSIPYTFNRGSGVFDNYIVMENANQYAYIQIKYNKGGDYNGNYTDEALDIVKSGGSVA